MYDEPLFVSYNIIRDVISILYVYDGISSL